MTALRTSAALRATGDSCRIVTSARQPGSVQMRHLGLDGSNVAIIFAGPARVDRDTWTELPRTVQLSQHPLSRRCGPCGPRPGTVAQEPSHQRAAACSAVSPSLSTARFRLDQVGGGQPGAGRVQRVGQPVAPPVQHGRPHQGDDVLARLQRPVVGEQDDRRLRQPRVGGLQQADLDLTGDAAPPRWPPARAC